MMRSTSAGSKPVKSTSKPSIDEALKLDRKDLVIPARLFSQPIVGKDVGALFRIS